MRYTPISSQLFVHNRQRLAQAIPESSAVVLKAGQPLRRSGDTDYPFRVNSDFFWATGIEEPESVVIITAAGASTLFLPKTSEFERLWNGPRLESSNAQAVAGITDVLPLSKLPSFKKTLLVKPLDPSVTHDIIKPLRMVKSQVEIDLMRRASAITAQGFKVALTHLQPNIPEFQLEAVITREFIMAGASGHAYMPIVASGSNACILHYIDNNCMCKEADTVLLDAGAEYANYAADVTRTWPVGGQFSTRQRAIYEAVLRVQRSAIKRLRPGYTLKESEIESAKHMTEELIQLGLLKPTAAKDFGKTKDFPFRRYFPHGLSHFLGLDTHDVGDYQRPLEPGMVLTVEPGIYIKEEAIGIRLEDDILITKDGTENLTADIPIEADLIESLIGRFGV